MPPRVRSRIQMSPPLHPTPKRPSGRSTCWTQPVESTEPPRVVRTVELAHAADAERAHDLVASDSRASGQGHEASRLYRSARGTLPAFMSTAEPVYVTSGLVRLTKPQLVGTLTGLLLAALLAAIDQTIVGTAEPRIIASLQGFDRYPWVATIYMLTSTVSVPIFASLSDRYGRKPFFMLGATLFVVSSALCGAAGEFSFLPIDGMGQLIVFRGLQGVAGGMVVGILFTIVGDIFSPIERGRYQGLFAALWGVASIFGPTLGGWLTDHWS